MDQMKLRSSEVAILFMQKEHANTLKGLHEEIKTLQQRCSRKCKRSRSYLKISLSVTFSLVLELQFKIAMDATYTGDDGWFLTKLYSKS